MYKLIIGNLVIITNPKYAPVIIAIFTKAINANFILPIFLYLIVKYTNIKTADILAGFI